MHILCTEMFLLIKSYYLSKKKKGVFVWFQAISGLKINLGKSKLVLVGVVPTVEALADIFSCKVSNLPTNNLGLPLGSIFKENSV